ncbi:MAG: M1 family aminopeptidase [Phycisphaerae bacterium]
MERRTILFFVLTVLLVAGIFGVGYAYWYFSTPQSAIAQLEMAGKYEARVRAEKDTLTPEQYQQLLGETIQLYETLETRFGKSDDAAEAWRRVAILIYEVKKNEEKALDYWEYLVKNYPAQEKNGGQALLEQGKILHRQADDLKSRTLPEADPKYKRALGKYEQYRTTFPAGPGAAMALMEMGRIWHEGLVEPPINALELFKKYLTDYPQGDDVPEAMYRLAKLYDFANEPETALRMLTDMTEKYPKSVPWTERALMEKGRLLSDKLHRQKEAAEAYEKMTKDFPDSPNVPEARSRSRSARQREAQQAGESYGKGRYGGTIPYDTLGDKAIPPAEQLKMFAQQKLDAQTYTLTVDIQPDQHRITVAGSLTLINRGDDKREILLMLANHMKVNSAAVNGVRLVPQLNGDTWRWKLPSIFRKDEQIKLDFSYTGIYAGPEAQQIRPQSTTTSRPATRPATRPAPGTLEPTTRPVLVHVPRAEDEPLVTPHLTVGEFGYGLSSGLWYPTTIIGDLFKADVKIRLHAPGEAVQNGRLVERKPGTATKPGEFKFSTDELVFGLYFAYGPYELQDETRGAIHYYTYLRPTNAKKHDAYVTAAHDILNFYSQCVVSYPYEKMAIVEVPLPPFLGGVGPASMMWLQSEMVNRKEVPTTLLAHELAHQWFGNLIPINLMDSDYSQWLSEGFATYLDALYTEKSEGANALRVHMLRYAQLFLDFTLRFPRAKETVMNCLPDSPLYRPVVYEKGAYVLHSLRYVMGDEKFFKLLRRWAETYRHTPANVEDFKRVATDVAGEDLRSFFALWLNSSGFAHYRIEKMIVKSLPDGKQSVTLNITQPDEIYPMPVDIRCYGSAGKVLTIAKQRLDKSEQVITFELPFQPERVELDPELWILRHPGDSNRWPRKE